MSGRTLFLSGWNAWAPGLETRAAQTDWAAGRAAIHNVPDSPALEFLPMLFRRRLSQLSRMVLQVGHALTGPARRPACVFASRYGEINKQYQITDTLIDSGEVSPGVFSLSVFNAPVFLLSIAEKIHASGTAVYSRDQETITALIEALGILSRPGETDCLVLFGDECLPSVYQPLFAAAPQPYALGMLLSREAGPEAAALRIDVEKTSSGPRPFHPLDLLRWLIEETPRPLTIHGPGINVRLRRNP